MRNWRSRLGKKGEMLARKFLRGKGYKIIAVNFSCRYGEIDLICRDRDVTVFVEVKTRSNCFYGLPQHSIGTKKINRLFSTAQFYISNYARGQSEEGAFRFDVVSIIWGETIQIELLKDALTRNLH
ncbi:MAG: YraN family protein [Candidatus Omnitrophota bacterium]